jgi:2-polyprenyl-3-methyl-5-hydroxy-6-metoxy-1,4-benzoquinol methylase
MYFYLKLFQLAIRRLKSTKDYYIFQAFQASRVVNDFVNLTKDRKICHKEVIDFGCGQGGYSSALSNCFKKVYAVDEFINLQKSKIFRANKKIKIVNSRLLDLRIKKADYLFCASVIEHIPPNNYHLFFEAINRNLKKNGLLYLSFPPFLSPIGGHHTAPFHYLPDKFAIYLTNKIKKRKIQSYEKMFGEWGLYKTSIGDIKKIISSNGFKIIQIRSRFMPNLYNKLFSKFDLLNWHCEIIAKKN